MTFRHFMLSALAVLLLAMSTPAAWAQPIPISQARTRPLGSSVTVTGIVTNGAELGSIRYLQDATGGIAAFGATQVGSLNRGDSVVITGVLKDYNNLLEFDPVTSVTVVSSGNSLPAPVVLTPSQLGEAYESQLVRINDATFALGGSNFAANTTYFFTAGGQQGRLYIRTGHPLVGTPIPMSEVTITGVLSQFFNNYQVLPRDVNDFVFNSALFFTQLPAPQPSPQITSPLRGKPTWPLMLASAMGAHRH